MTNSSWKSSFGFATDEGNTVSWLKLSSFSVAASPAAVFPTSVSSHRLSAFCSAVSVTVCVLTDAEAYCPTGTVVSWLSETVINDRIKILSSTTEHLRAAIFPFRCWLTSVFYVTHERSQWPAFLWIPVALIWTSAPRQINIYFLQVNWNNWNISFLTRLTNTHETFQIHSKHAKSQCRSYQTFVSCLLNNLCCRLI